MCTSQKYAGEGNATTPPTQAAQNAAPTPATGDNRQATSIPAYLLNFSGNWELAEAIRIAQCPTTTGVNPTFVLAAIEAAFQLGKQEGREEMEGDELVLSSYGNLFECVDDFFSYTGNPVEVINRVVCQDKQAYRIPLRDGDIETLLRVVTFIYGVRQSRDEVSSFIDEAKKGGARYV